MSQYYKSPWAAHGRPIGHGYEPMGEPQGTRGPTTYTNTRVSIVSDPWDSNICQREQPSVDHVGRPGFRALGRGSTVGLTWVLHGSSVDFPWVSHGHGLLWVSHGSLRGPRWVSPHGSSHGSPIMESPMDLSSGSPVGLPWAPHESFMVDRMFHTTPTHIHDGKMPPLCNVPQSPLGP